jgi:type III restriction enzyme
MRILESTLETLRKRGHNEEQLYAARLDIIQDMRRLLRQQVNEAAETLFREKLKQGDIALHLHSANDPVLDWEIRKTIEVIGSEFLQKKHGGDLERSLFEKLPANEFNSLEKNTAWYLDERESIRWWHRLAIKQGPGLQGWQRQRIYPDFLACMQVTNDGYRLALLETKGKHLEGSEDTTYKERLFELLTEFADKSHVVGELDLGKPIQMTFTMLMEDSWSQDIAKAGVA